MEIIKMLLEEMEREAETTRKMLSRVPEDKYGWKPHEKSMTMQRLATHIAELPGWVTMALTTDELDFAKGDYKPEMITRTADLLDYFERNLASGREHLAKATLEQLEQPWTMRNGEQVYDVSPKVNIIRIAYCQTVHHRAQLGVYLRLLDIPIPGSYGPSADENVFESEPAAAN